MCIFALIMKKSAALIFFLWLLPASCLLAKGELDALLLQLDKEIALKHFYEQQKEREIQGLKHLLDVAPLQPLQEYDINDRLAQKYRKYIIDSAIFYAKRSGDIAAAVHRPDLAAESNLNLSYLYATAGMYVEAKNILLAINRRQLPKTLLPLYFETCSDFYGYYGQSNNQVINGQLNIAYRDSLLATLDTASLSYKIHNAVRLVYSQTDIKEPYLLALFDQVPEGGADYALVSYLLGLIYTWQHDVEQGRKYFTLSAIADIRNATKDHAALQSLALSYYGSGDVNRAYTYIKSVMEDIAFGNIRFRAIELTSFYSAINTAYLTKTMQQKKELQHYLLLISVLLCCLMVAGFYVYRQMRRVSKIRKELYETNLKLAELNKNTKHINNQLQKVNAQLSEANLIKEEYIAQFFDICSGYINKLENYRKLLYKKAGNKQHEELFNILKSTTLVDEERGKLYETFDTIFLNLYPSFVEDFNSLLINEEKSILKPGERLNTELRIFALIRLGITDSVRIAGFLRYSLSTIYNYRTRARNNAVVSRSEFEEMVMNIGAIQEKR
jgi:DNA-binding CsgD family transcriptional regulator